MTGAQSVMGMFKHTEELATLGEQAETAAKGLETVATGTETAAEAAEIPVEGLALAPILLIPSYGRSSQTEVVWV
jgi:hypothetical protein